jgi:hypothetical protein
MSVGKVNRKKERSVDEFISGGGSVAHNGNTKPKDELRMTLRCPVHLIEKLDEARKGRPGRVSRNQAIVEALSDHLEQDHS